MTEPTFHAASKLAWIEQVTTDRRSKHFHTCVAVAIMRRIIGNGEATRKQTTIGNIIGAGERGVRKAIKEMCENGHLEIVCGGIGRGQVTTYRPIIKKRNGGSAFLGDEIAEKRNEKTRNSGARKAEQECTKSGTVVPPKTPIRILKEIPGARARAGENPPSLDSLAGRWRAIKEGLARSERFGPDRVTAWLEKLEPDRVEQGRAVLLAPSKFIANRVTTDFADQVLAQWRELDASVVRLEIVPAPDRLRAVKAAAAVAETSEGGPESASEDDDLPAAIVSSTSTAAAIVSIASTASLPRANAC